MACARCSKNKAAINKNIFTTALDPYPFKANDISVIEGGIARGFKFEDWDNTKHKLLIFIPKTFTPVCQTELGAINKYVKEFQKYDCEIIACGTDPANSFVDWYNEEEILKDPLYKTFSSYLLPSRIGILEYGRSKRASVFIMKNGDMVRMEHFNMVGRSFAELHRMLYAYSTDSYCAEGWQGPEDSIN